MVGLGIADGVYMWKTQGIDAGLFSRALMDTARREVEGGAADALAGAGPRLWGAQALAGSSPALWHLYHGAAQDAVVLYAGPQACT